MIDIKRRKTPTAHVGHIAIGSKHPIVIQSMTNTPTSDVARTVAQIKELSDAGSELVRITINDVEAMKAVGPIVHELRKGGYATPIVGDFHYNGHLLLKEYPQEAKLLGKYRINPGNVGKGERHNAHFSQIIETAIKNNKSVRIGVNLGSLDQELLTEQMSLNAKAKNPKSYRDVVYDTAILSTLQSAQLAEKIGLGHDKIVLSIKMSDVQDLIEVNRRLARQCDYVLHLGLTEAGGALYGVTSSSAALGILLQEGIGDTIRFSLTPDIGAKRSLEVEACKSLLQSMRFRYFSPRVTSCPGCGRTDNDYFQRLAKEINDYVDKHIPQWKKDYPGVERLTIAVMGCIVNGPGESKHADIGISLPGTNEEPVAPIFVDGENIKTLKGKNIKEDFLAILEGYIKRRYKNPV